MNKTAQDQPAKPRRALWIAGFLVLLLAAISVWWFRSRLDSRFVGTWEHDDDVAAGSMQTFELRGDGSGDLIPAPGKTLPVRWWYDGGSICMRPAKRSIAGEFLESFQTAVGMQPDYTMRLHVSASGDSHFDYIGLGRGKTLPEPGAEARTVTRRKE